MSAPKIDFEAVDRPRFVRPELLRHGTIPRPLLGLSPRYIEGPVWWEEHRKAVYPLNNMRCFACGGPGPLAAHECYDIEYSEGVSQFREIVALCNLCHNFIHIGRLISELSRSKVTLAYFKKVVVHGNKVLHNADLKCPSSIRLIEHLDMYFKMDMNWIIPVLRNCDPRDFEVQAVSWQQWRLIYKGIAYPPRFTSHEDASNYYLTEE